MQIMKKCKILFMIHNLGGGGAERILVNLVNHLDQTRFDVTLISLFGGGINAKRILPHVRYCAVWPRMVRGNSKIMKLFTPESLHRKCVKEHYDVEVAFLEGPTARIISGCPDRETKLISWIHISLANKHVAAKSFRSYAESVRCYERFHRVVTVSEGVRDAFRYCYPDIHDIDVLYNPLEPDLIRKKSKELVAYKGFKLDEWNIVQIGRISRNKGFDRIARITERLREEDLPVHVYVVGAGEEKKSIEKYLRLHQIEEYYTFLGYQKNPYPYIASCDLFVCSSLAEGYSTATAEALIIGTSVCSVDVAGTKELLGDSEWGLVTENNEDALYHGIRRMITEPGLLEHYREKAFERGKAFSLSRSVKAIEESILELIVK